MGSLSSPLLACIVFCIPDTCRLKSIKVENHKKLWNRLLSISDTCQLISIEFDRQWLTFIDFRNYRHVTYVLLFVSPLQPLSFNIVISKPHTLITWTIQDVLFDQIFLYFIEKIIKSFLAILKAIYSQLLDDLQQHLKTAMLKFKWGLKLIYLN